MKKINQYLPFILWSVATIILTILAFIFLPVLLLIEKFKSYTRKDAMGVNVNDDKHSKIYIVPC